MPCACQTNKTKSKYVATLPTGEKKTYQTEIEAKAAVQRAGGGTVRPA
jgi:hypothetical protein